MGLNTGRGAVRLTRPSRELASEADQLELRPLLSIVFELSKDCIGGLALHSLSIGNILEDCHPITLA